VYDGLNTSCDQAWPWLRRTAVTGDPLDVELEDPELLAEVDLTATLIAAANQTEGRLAPEEIDRLLGLG